MGEAQLPLTISNMHMCSSMPCNVVRKAPERRLEEQAIKLLTNLNDNFSVVRTQIFLMDPLHPLIVYTLLWFKKRVTKEPHTS